MVAKHGEPITIKRFVETDDEYGGQIKAWSILYRNTPARFVPATTSNAIVAALLMAYDKATTMPDYFVYVEGTLTVRENDRIFMSNGREFGIKKVHSFAEKGYQLVFGVTEIGRNEA